MRSWFAPPARRIVEATPAQVVQSGASLGSWGRDPVDNDTGYRSITNGMRGGRGGREVPDSTREQLRNYSVAAYRLNPMATAVIDTMTAFCVGDSGVSPQAMNPQVAEVVREFWDDPANRLGHIQDLLLRDQLLIGETLLELMVGRSSGVVRFAPIDASHIKDVLLRNGNPLWPSKVILPGDSSEERDRTFNVVQVNDKTGLREGQAVFWAPFRTLSTDVRGMPFMMSILDWLDNYDTVLSNLIDRTSLMRHIAYSVKLRGAGPAEVQQFIANRGGIHMPKSGTVEVHNDDVEWTPISGQTNAAEDTQANASVLTNVAAGAGLAKTWLADPDGANRATSLSMAEPVRRRVGAVQNVWLYQMTELCRFVVDRAVASGRLPATVEAVEPRTGETTEIPASQAVTVTGPRIAAADSQLAASVLLNLSTAIEALVMSGALSKEAGEAMARKGWEEYMGTPYQADLGKPGAPRANEDDIATAIEESAKVRRHLRLTRTLGGAAQ